MELCTHLVSADTKAGPEPTVNVEDISERLGFRLLWWTLSSLKGEHIQCTTRDSAWLCSRMRTSARRSAPNAVLSDLTGAPARCHVGGV